MKMINIEISGEETESVRIDQIESVACTDLGITVIKLFSRREIYTDMPHKKVLDIIEGNISEPSVYNNPDVEFYC